jgi:hypothetical protein
MSAQPALLLPPAVEPVGWDQLESFAHCHRAHRLRHAEARPPAFVPVEVFHEDVLRGTVTWFLAHWKRGDPVPEPALVAEFQRRWRLAHALGVRAVRAGERVEAYAHRAELMLRRFASSWAHDGYGRLETVDRTYVCRVAGRHDLAVRVDAVVRPATGPLEVIAFDARPHPVVVPQALDALQARATALAVLIAWRVDAVSMVRYVLADGQRHVEVLDGAAAGAVTGVLARLLDDLAVAAGDDQPTPSPRCGWCGYRDGCAESGFPRGFVPLGEFGPCPRCGAGLGLRSGRSGIYVTCSGAPVCRYTRDL